MKETMFYPLIIVGLLSSDMLAKTVSQHEAIEKLNKATGMLVLDQQKTNVKLDEALKRIESLEKYEAQNKIDATKKQATPINKEEIELDKKILDYVNGKK